MNAFLWGMAVGCLIMFIPLILPTSIISKYYDVMEQCEAELPRNQQCELYARPKGEE